MAQPQRFAVLPPLDATVRRRWSPLDPQALLLANSLRGAPVTLAHGSDAADREDLLTFGLMPLLGRRGDDRAEPTRRARVLPFPDRRRPLGHAAAATEWVLLFDDWHGPPLEPLVTRIERARVPREADAESPVRVLLVMQNFEAALESAASAIHPDRFWLELAQAVRIEPHGLHLLLITQEADTPSLRWLGEQLPGLGDQALSLEPARAGVAPQLTAVPGLIGEAAPGVEPKATMPVISEQDWLEAVQGAVERAAEQVGTAKLPVVLSPGPLQAASPVAAPALAPPSDAALIAAAALHPAVDALASRARASASAANGSPTAPSALVPTPGPGPAPAAPSVSAVVWASALAARVVSREPHPAAAPSARGGGLDRRLLPVLALVACAGLALAWWGGGSAERTLDAITGSTPMAARATARLTEPRSPEPTASRSEPVAADAASAPPATVTAAAAASVALPAPVMPPLPNPPPTAEPPVRLAEVTAPLQRAPFDAEPGSALRGLLAGIPLLDLRVGVAQAAARLEAVRKQPTLALMRYDTLRMLPASAGLDGLRLVAPLFIEPVRVWVRADSPRRRLDDLGQGVIDVGRNDGDAGSASGVTTALFGKPVPASRQRHLSDAQALTALQQGVVDAVLRVQASTLTDMAAASVAKGDLRLLPLDGESRASSQALRDYLPTPVSSASAGRTLGVMSFLVVQGGEGAGRQRLALEALRALCTGLPALKAAAPLRWAEVSPGVQLPAGRPYALTAEQAAEQASHCGPGALQPSNEPLNSPTSKGNSP